MYYIHIYSFSTLNVKVVPIQNIIFSNPLYSPKISRSNKQILLFV